MPNWRLRWRADDTSFNRLVLKSPIPTIALFVAPWCEICEPCFYTFERLAEGYRERVGFVVLDLDESRVIAESFGIQSAPTYLLFRDGELIAYGLGYLPEPLLDLFFQRAIVLTNPSKSAWSPTEQEIEDALLLPMLARWGWVCQRQYQLTRSGSRTRRGVIDLLVSVHATQPPLTLFENKRRIADNRDLQRAMKQALGYAITLGLPSFVIADAAMLWVYYVYQGGALLVQQFTWLELEQSDSVVQSLLLTVSGSPAGQ
jgi:thioredoxin 1